MRGDGHGAPLHFLPITARPLVSIGLVSIGDESTIMRSRLPLTEWSSSMQMRRRFIQSAPLSQRLTEEAQRLRKEAQGTQPGVERERLIRRAGQAETASHINQWLSSPGLEAPK
jgi:hypothetical protein